jgi:hypothetical protein
MNPQEQKPIDDPTQPGRPLTEQDPSPGARDDQADKPGSSQEQRQRKPSPGESDRPDDKQDDRAAAQEQRQRSGNQGEER